MFKTYKNISDNNVVQINLAQNNTLDFKHHFIKFITLHIYLFKILNQWPLTYFKIWNQINNYYKIVAEYIYAAPFYYKFTYKCTILIIKSIYRHINENFKRRQNVTTKKQYIQKKDPVTLNKLISQIKMKLRNKK